MAARFACCTLLLLAHLGLAACSRHADGIGRSRAPTEATPARGELRWIGGPTAVIQRDGMRVLTDPMLGPRGEHAFVLPKHPSSGAPDAAITRYLAPASLDVTTLDAILVSHMHADHFDDTAKAVLPKTLPLVVNRAGADAVRAAGFLDVRALDWGESTTLAIRGARLRMTAVPAHHAHDAALDQSLGRGNGYLLDWDGYRAFWTGDAVLSDETLDAARYGTLDLLLPHMGGVGGDGGHGLRTMDAAELLQLVERLQPRAVIPIHHTTFGHYREPIEALAQRAAERGQLERYRFPKQGIPLPL